MQFGPNTGTPITSVTGAPITVLNVQIGGYDPNGGYWSLPRFSIRAATTERFRR